MKKIFVLVDRKTQLSERELEVANSQWTALGTQLDALGIYFKDNEPVFKETKRYFDICGTLLKTGKVKIEE